ncbi:MAG: DUF5320 domain-containing protein [Candidatus Izemoplasmatales bacterium]|jgi:hypothetical protein
MPRNDGSGPYGNGPMTGRGLGYCQANRNVSFRRGYRCGGYFGQVFGMNQNQTTLEAEKKALEVRLEAVERMIKESK